jgi:uncharacterized protein YjbI with pentapeptide repeats
MADAHHLQALSLGLHSWNSWRTSNPDIKPDLSGADLQGREFDYFDLRWANFAKADLSGTRAINVQFDHANLVGAQLHQVRTPDATYTGADLSEAKLSDADLSECNFADAQLRSTQLSRARLIGAQFVRTYLGLAELSGADLRRADFRGAVLAGTNLTGANMHQATLEGAAFEGAILGNTIIADTSLRGISGLETCTHKGPSSIDIRTLSRSGELPAMFLRGCGFADTFIDYLPSLLTQAIEYYSCFISYSAADDIFVRRLHADLQNAGVRCWFAPEDMKIGDRIRDRIDQSIRLHDKLLLVLSRASIGSHWVEKEVETAMEQERRKCSTILFPISVDDEFMNTHKAWAADIRRTRHVGDFRNYYVEKNYSESFARLLRDLRGSQINLAGRPPDFDDDIPF